MPLDAKLITHISTGSAWSSFKESSDAGGPGYGADPIASCGFIHLSTQAQVESTLNLWFPPEKHNDLVLFLIDPSLLPDASALKYEAPVHPSASDDTKSEEKKADEPLFPHLYSLLSLSAVVGVLSVKAGDDGKYSNVTNAPSIYP